MALVAICLWFVVCADLYRRTIPAFEGQDEIWHVLMGMAIGQGTLPVAVPPGQPRLLWDQVEAAQPPAYYAAVAPVLRAVSIPELQAALVRNPHGSQGSPDGVDNRNLFARSPAGSRAETLIGRARLVSIAFGLGTVLLTYLAARRALPDRPAARILATALVAFLPGHLFISVLVTNDNGADLFGALVLWLALAGAWLLRDRRVQIGAGLALGALALSKTSGLLGAPLLGLGLLLARGARWRERVLAGLVVGLVATLVAGWWYVRNLVLYGELTALSYHLHRADLSAERATVGEVLADFPGLYLSFVGIYGWFSIVMTPSWYGRYGLLFALGALGGLVALVGWCVRRRPVSRELLVCAAWVLLVLGALIAARFVFRTFHGRLLYPCLPALAILWARGAVALLPGRLAMPAALAVAAVLGWWALLVPARFIAPAYAIPPLGPACQREAAASAPGPIELVGAEVPDELMPSQPFRVELCWRVRAAPGAAWSVFAQLIDPAGRVVALHDGFPGGGNDATTWWAPGSLHADPHTLTTHRDLDVPRVAELRTGFYDAATGRRVPGVAPDGGDTVTAGRVRIVGPPLELRGPELGAWPNDGVVAAQLDLADRQPGPWRGTLYFKATGPPTGRYTVSIQLLGPAGLVAQEDKLPRGGLFPTDAWRAGDVVPHSFELGLPRLVDGTRYRLLAVLYDPTSGRRLPTTTGDMVQLAELCERGGLAGCP